jgi:hypothetical protein
MLRVCAPLCKIREACVKGCKNLVKKFLAKDSQFFGIRGHMQKKYATLK